MRKRHAAGGNFAALDLSGEPGVIGMAGEIAGFDVGLPEAGDQDEQGYDGDQGPADAGGHGVGAGFGAGRGLGVRFPRHDFYLDWSRAGRRKLSSSGKTAKREAT